MSQTVSPVSCVFFLIDFAISRHMVPFDQPEAAAVSFNVEVPDSKTLNKCNYRIFSLAGFRISRLPLTPPKSLNVWLRPSAVWFKCIMGNSCIFLCIISVVMYRMSVGRMEMEELSFTIDGSQCLHKFGILLTRTVYFSSTSILDVIAYWSLPSQSYTGLTQPVTCGYRHCRVFEDNRTYSVNEDFGSSNHDYALTTHASLFSASAAPASAGLHQKVPSRVPRCKSIFTIDCLIPVTLVRQEEDRDSS